MALQYVGLNEINGSLVVLDHVKGASYDEMVEIQLKNGTTRSGRVVQIEGEKIVVQVFEVNPQMLPQDLLCDGAAGQGIGVELNIQMHIRALARAIFLHGDPVPDLQSRQGDDGLDGRL